MERLEDRLLELNDYNLAARIIQNNDIQNCLVELSEYKDTGLTPEEIIALQSERDQIGMTWDDSKRYAKRLELERDNLRAERDTLKKALELADSELPPHYLTNENGHKYGKMKGSEYFIQQVQEGQK